MTDNKGRACGDAVSYIEHRALPLRSGKTIYVWMRTEEAFGSENLSSVTVPIHFDAAETFVMESLWTPREDIGRTLTAMLRVFTAASRAASGNGAITISFHVGRPCRAVPEKA